MSVYDEYRYVNEDDVRKLFPARDKDSHKGSFGYVALVGGSNEYSGAIRLAAIASSAVRTGAGVATVAAPRSICHIVAGAVTESTIYPLSDDKGELVFAADEFEKLCDKYDVIAFGMGIGNSEETKKTVEYLLGNYKKTLIVDADGLNAMSQLNKDIIRKSDASLLLTPHVKEFSRLSGVRIEDIKADPLGAAKKLAFDLGVTVLLKGSTTAVAGQDGTVLLSDRGCPGMATGGSGDVLSGILAALCVNADDMVMAAAVGAYINGLAGEIAEQKRSEVTMTAHDTAICVAEAVESVIKHSLAHTEDK